MEESKKVKQLTLRIPESMHREFKANTAKKGQSMGKVTLELIQKYLNEETEPM